MVSIKDTVPINNEFIMPVSRLRNVSKDEVRESRDRYIFTHIIASKLYFLQRVY